MSASSKNVAEVILEYLRLEGVDTIFGVPGGGLIEMLEVLYEQRNSMSYVVCRQETGAAYMADGYFRASGKLGVAMVTTGPGATNALTGVMNAESAHSALLLLTGEIAEQYYGMGYLQEGIDSKLDVNTVYQASVSSSAIISAAENARTLIEAALRTTGGVPHRAAHLSLPVNVTQAPVPDFKAPAAPSEYRATARFAAPEDVERTLAILSQAKRPLLMLGNGCREALRDKATYGALLRLVEELAIPVVTTADGKGVFPEDHGMSLRMFGLANSIWPYYWFNQTDPAYDALVVIGSSLGELATNKWNPMLRPASGDIVQVDADARAVGKVFPLRLGVVGEAGAFIRGLEERSTGIAWDQKDIAARRATMAGIQKDHSPFFSPDDYNSTSGPAQPAALCRVMQEELPADKTIVMLDAGNCVGWGGHYLVSKPGFEVHSSLDMGPMGFGVAAVVGAKIARKDAQCVCVTGDGAFMMQGAEISTAQRNGVGAIWVVLHDNDLAMVSQGMEHFMGGDIEIWRRLYSLGEPDLAKFAEGLGAEAATVSDPEAFRTALRAAMTGAETGRPQVIVAEIDRDAIPPYYNPLYAPTKAQAREALSKAKSK